ncbi:MAG TPA: HD domain-containing phosphohydrolase [Syntrophales bacterium]|nr:HD domain-containing phosphohydrolase [Syntrophales bacterium]
MTFYASVTALKSKRIFLVFFFLASILPIMVLLLILRNYILPSLSAAPHAELEDIFQTLIAVMLLLPFLSFFLMYRWLKSFEAVTSEIAIKSNEIVNREKEFAGQVINGQSDYVKTSADLPDDSEENEMQTIINSFNNIFQTATDQLAERNRLKELLGKLIGVASNLTSELDFDRLFPLIVGNVTDAISAERSSLYVVDWDKEEIWTKVSEGIDTIHIPLGRGISGLVAETGKEINVEDAWELPYFDRYFDLHNNFRTRSVLCVPIEGRSGTTIGVLQVINKKGKDRFDNEDEVLMRGLTSQVGIALENSMLVDEILISFNSSIKTLSSAVDARHPFTAGHSERVREYSLKIAYEMKLSKEDIETLSYAALLHDIGKIGISDAVLMKNGPFNADDWAEMKTHPQKTKHILDNLHFKRHLRQVPDIAFRHHEKINGEGYPEGIVGKQIPLGAKIIAVGDVFDALTSKRDYPKYNGQTTLSHDPMTVPDAIEILKNQSGSHFDPSVVNAFIKSLS